MITKLLNHRGIKQPVTFLTEGDTITEDCFHIATFRDDLTYNEMVMRVIKDFNKHTRGFATTMAGYKVEEFPERVYYKL
jgi:hypothetical protein